MFSERKVLATFCQDLSFVPKLQCSHLRSSPLDKKWHGLMPQRWLVSYVSVGFFWCCLLFLLKGAAFYLSAAVLQLAVECARCWKHRQVWLYFRRPQRRTILLRCRVQKRIMWGRWKRYLLFARRIHVLRPQSSIQRWQLSRMHLI